MLDKLDETEIVTLFGKTIAERGRRYQRDGAVKYLEARDDNSTLTAEVEGSEAEPYEVELTVLPRKSGFMIRGYCTCPYGMGCKHMAAALYEMLHRRQVRSPAMTRRATQDMLMDESVSLWLSQLSAASQPHSTEFIVYLLSLSPHGTPDLSIEVTRILKAGGYGKSRKLRIDQLLRSNANYITEEDRMLGYLLSSGVHYGASLPNIPQMVDMALTRMIETGRGRWLRHDAPPLRLGPTRPGRVNWELGPDGCQRPVLEAEGLVILKAASPWYVDPQSGEAGLLDFGMSAAALRTLMQAPPISPSQAGRVAAALRERVGQARVEPPRADVREEVLTGPPVPCLTLAMRPSLAPVWGTTVAPGPQPVAYLSYAYGEVAVDSRTAPQELRRTVNGRILRIRRDMGAEKKAATRLGKSGLSQYFMPNAENSPGLPYHFHDDGESNWLDFLHSGVPALEAEGWRIVTAPDFTLKVARDAEFDADLSESGGFWFSMDLGIEVEGRRRPLLPMLVALLKSLPSDTDPIQALKAKSRNNVIYLPAGQGLHIPIPVERLHSILRVLVELGSGGELDEHGRLKVSPLHAQPLAEIEAALKPRWLGGERLRQLAQRLRDFSGLGEVALPETFTAELRPYQRQGLSWLQFLREYELGGILADDMGLGKTVQTLAHLSVEKAAGRLDRPALAVMPTSLVPTWRDEAARFAPDLRVVTLHGADRASRRTEMDSADLVLTTYALLPRDGDVFLERDWHVVVLDEAQAIKNPRTKAADVARRLKARHRLCLTGTPVENHLGELWSLFGFLMPGALGDMKQFGKLFRTPIEKKGDDARRLQLAGRVKPFLLRRTKDQVAGELPPKTEIVRRIDLTGAQRDLYETLRLAMHSKVRKEIDKKGLARSHIVILDALLKLRQACCDPRLVKLPTARKVNESAKLEALLEMLGALAAEGRRVLVFSQFTSMLDLIGPALREAGIAFVELRGDTEDRATPVKRFQTGAVPVFLISLKAGGTGLTLTAADTVIHYDPWWNPAVERQATDRAHRIGQSKSVFVYKLIASGTVEERMLELQDRKRAIAEAVFDSAQGEGPALQAEDLEKLFEPLG